MFNRTAADGTTRHALNRLCLLAVQSAFVAACAHSIPGGRRRRGAEYAPRSRQRRPVDCRAHP